MKPGIFLTSIFFLLLTTVFMGNGLNAQSIDPGGVYSYTGPWANAQRSLVLHIEETNGVWQAFMISAEPDGTDQQPVMAQVIQVQPLTNMVTLNLDGQEYEGILTETPERVLLILSGVAGTLQFQR